MIPTPRPAQTPSIALPVDAPTAKPIRIAAVRKQPPARVLLGSMAEQWQSARLVARAIGRLASPLDRHGQRCVDDVHRQCGNRTALNASPMDAPFISGRPALRDAAELIEAYGDNAGLEAAFRAERSRDAGNVERFCHWRQIERVITALSSEEVRGSVH